MERTQQFVVVNKELLIAVVKDLIITYKIKSQLVGRNNQSLQEFTIPEPWIRIASNHYPVPSNKSSGVVRRRNYDLMRPTSDETRSLT